MLIKLVIKSETPKNIYKMKNFVYIITDRNRNNLHVGLCSDLLKTLEFYSEMPTLFFDSSKHLTRLVYFEEINNEAQAMDRFKYVSTFTRAQKEKMIRSANSDWMDLTKGLQIEQQMYSRPAMRPAVTSTRKSLTF
jgi:putative endonuclease